MNKTLKDWIGDDPESQRLFAQEQLIVAVAEHIWEQMDAGKRSKAELAAALNKSKAFITQVLNGTRNMTLRTLSDIAFVLDKRCEIRFQLRVPVDCWTTSSTSPMLTSVVCKRDLQHKPPRGRMECDLPVAA